MSLLAMFGMESLSPSPSNDFWYAPINTSTPAGISVDEAKALTYSGCWAATMLLSSSGGMIPLKLKKKLRSGGSETASEHNVHKLISRRPNPEMTAMMFRSSRMAHQINRGNCFAEIERNKADQPINLWPVHASRIPSRNVTREGGQLVYYINNDDGSKTRIPSEDMLHIPSPMSEDGIWGMGVVEKARLTIAGGIAAETQAAAYFGNSARPALVIEGQKVFASREDRDDFRRQWNEMHGGPENNGKPAFLPPNTKATVLSFNAQDSQFLESRQFSIEDIARWYAVPPHLIGHLLRATYSNIEHLSLEFVKYSLMRWLVLWEQEINRKLLTEDEQEIYFARFVVDALERGDLQTRTAALKDQFFNGKITLNEWRALDDENPIGASGDIHFVQQAMIPVDMAAKGPPQPEAPKPPEEPEEEPEDDADLSAEMKALLATSEQQTAQLIAAVKQEAVTADSETLAVYRDLVSGLQKDLETSRLAQQQLASAMLKDVWSRMLSVEVNAVKRVAEKASKFDARLREFYDKHTGTLARNLRSPVAAYCAAHGKEAGDAADKMASDHVSESLRQLEALTDCQPEELQGRVELCVSQWHESRLASEPSQPSQAEILAMAISRMPHPVINVTTPEQTIHVAPASVTLTPAQVLVENNVNLPEQPAPVVNVTNEAPQINVPLQPEFDIVPERDKDGVTKRFRRVPKDK